LDFHTAAVARYEALVHKAVEKSVSTVNAESTLSTSFPLTSDAQRFAFQWIVERSPVGYAPHPALLEQSCGVFRKALQKIVELTFIRMVSPKFIHLG
jgi:hypothetical protein